MQQKKEFYFEIKVQEFPKTAAHCTVVFIKHDEMLHILGTIFNLEKKADIQQR